MIRPNPNNYATFGWEPETADWHKTAAGPYVKQQPHMGPHSYGTLTPGCPGCEAIAPVPTGTCSYMHVINIPDEHGLRCHCGKRRNY